MRQWCRMGALDTGSDSVIELRTRAQNPPSVVDAVAPINHQEALALVEDLRIHQIELGMQNEELKRTQDELEASRAGYFDLYNLAPVGYITADEQGCIIESNLRAATLLGTTHASLKHRIFPLLVASEDRHLFYLARKNLMETGNPQVTEVKLRRVDGSAFWALLEMSLPRDRASKACWIVVVDITDRRLAELRFDAFIQYSPNGASIVDEDGNYVSVNPAMQQLRPGRTGDFWIGRGFSDIWPPDLARRLKLHHQNAIVNGEVISETETLQLGGAERVYQTLYFPFAGPNSKKLVGCFAVDITERHRLETALREANVHLEAAKTKAEDATEAKSQFLSALSHEIRTPLNGVVGMSDLLLKSDLSTEQQIYAQVVADSAEALLALVNNVLDFSKIEAGKLELEEISFDLESLMEEALNLVSFKAREKSLDLAMRYPAGAPRQFWGDRTRLHQVLMNFLSNAVKFTDTGSVLAEAEVSETEGGAFIVRLSVVDTGIGISEDKIDNLFQRFGQANANIARRFGGTGLGLSIAKQLVEMMHGRVGASGKEGEGSTFYCQLPLKVDWSPRPATEPDASLAGIPVIVAGRANVSSKVLVESCHQWQMQVRQCDMDELPGLLTSSEARVVIVDGSMEVLQQGIRCVVTPKLVLISSDPYEKHKDLAADAVLSTPVRARTLRETLQKVLSLTPVKSESAYRTPAVQPVIAPISATVLVVDDNIINQKLASTLLSKMGCTVDTANDGVAAVKKVLEKEYDLIFMDCIMPNMDGFETTEAIRNLAGTAAHLPIVALTASSTIGDRDRCLAAGMNDFLTKPIRSEELAATLTKWVVAGVRAESVGS